MKPAITNSKVKQITFAKQINYLWNNDKKNVIRYNLQTGKSFHKGCIWYMRPTTQIYQWATSIYSYSFVCGQIFDYFNLIITNFQKTKIRKVDFFCLRTEKTIKTFLLQIKLILKLALKLLSENISSACSRDTSMRSKGCFSWNVRVIKSVSTTQLHH